MRARHLFRVLWLFWTQQDLEREAWPWVEQLLPAAGTLDPQARPELAWRRCWPGSPTPSCTRWPSWISAGSRLTQREAVAIVRDR
jgi:hypothetical protein